MVNEITRRLWAFVPAAGAGIVFLVVTSLRVIPDAARVIAIACLVLSALAAIFVQTAEVRSHAASALAIGAVVAVGQGKSGLPFAVPAGVFALLVVLAMRKAKDPDARTHGRGGVIMFVVAAGVFGSLLTALPPMGGVVERQINKWISTPISNGDAVGFTSRMRLGSTRNMLRSDRVVLRITGPTDDIEYLRGAVYDDYEGRIWSTTRYKTEPVDAVGENAKTTIRYTLGAPVAQGEEARWFLPPNACNIHTRSGRIAVNPFHVYQPEPRSDIGEISFDTKGCPPLPAVPPQGYDLEVPSNVFTALGPIARAWTAGANTDVEKVDAISRHLQAYGYSLDVQRSNVDPVIDFLTIHKEGHCELFASSLVLLARLSHVPARVVTGYHVSERSTVFEHAVVRERNAHAWAEVFVGGSWRAVDPTPISDIPDRSGTWERFSENVSFEWERLTSELTLTHFIVAAIVAGGLFLLRRWWVARRAEKGRRLDAASLPLPCFVTLESSLARAGHVREPSEPVEVFAARIETSGAPWATVVAEATRRYASHRYGGASDERDVEKAVIAAARAVSGAPT